MTNQLNHKLFSYLFQKNCCSRQKMNCRLLFESYHDFIENIEKLIDIIQKINLGCSFTDESIQTIIKDKYFQKITHNFPTEYAFKRLSLIHFLNTGNSIISTCSLLSSVCKYAQTSYEKYDIIAYLVDSKITQLIDLINITIDIQREKYHQYDISNDIKQFFSNTLHEKRNEFIQRKKSYDNLKFQSFMCYNCNEYPAATALLPCCHSFLCIHCIEAAMKSDSFASKCYVCGKKVTDIIRLNSNYCLTNVNNS
ncbi:hypothetical protein TRFO_27318 [Tritrichomonas foetus]|uniref:RING-type domain-containing protein n=1 Tax=Tritrichomonas foetus TaxID=1144522 RepID=A0A1J4K197_9EUKA|nr:hypothetical protein TRFO_27318 [Tritrichomonas foetus]|eukprot:OHT05011.1 hypothetical protein TRFO_27318 [Tritrichomonas foetus]